MSWLGSTPRSIYASLLGHIGRGNLFVFEDLSGARTTCPTERVVKDLQQAIKDWVEEYYGEQSKILRGAESTILVLSGNASAGLI